MISINFTGDSTDYTNALQAVRYINTEVEPTLFVSGSYLMREVVIRITDMSTVPAATTNEVRVTVQIEPINGNTHSIIINSDPVCTEDYRDREGEVHYKKYAVVLISVCGYLSCIKCISDYN